MKAGVSSMNPKPSVKARDGRPQTSHHSKNRVWRSQNQVDAHFFYDSKGIVHKEFVPTGQTVNAIFYLLSYKARFEALTDNSPRIPTARINIILHHK